MSKDWNIKTALAVMLGLGVASAGAEGTVNESRSELRDRTETTLVHGERRTRHTGVSSVSGQFAAMPQADYPVHGFQLQATATPSLMAFYQPQRATTITVPLTAGDYRGGGLQFVIPAKADTTTMVRVQAVYDFNGNGQPDRVEMYHPTFLDAGTSTITHASGMELNRSYGHFATNQGGTLTLHVWIPEGVHGAELLLDEAYVKAPFIGNHEVTLAEHTAHDGWLTPAQSNVAFVQCTNVEKPALPQASQFAHAWFAPDSGLGEQDADFGLGIS